MVQYLSAEWLARLPRAEDGDELPAGPGATLTLRHVVRDAPGGHEARYDIRVTGDGPVLTRSGRRRADVTFTTDYETAAAIASGTLSTQAALAAGRLKVGGDLGALAGIASSLGGREVLPPSLRDDTEFVR
ncbi:MAG: SCP2 sterol-binding domain-containing protein [Acidimicrobiales bacterium]